MLSPIDAVASHGQREPAAFPGHFRVSRRTEQPAAMGTSTSAASPSRWLTTVKGVGTKWPLPEPKLATAASHSPGDSRSTRARAAMHLPGKVGSDQDPLALPVRSTTPPDISRVDAEAENALGLVGQFLRVHPHL